MGSKKPRKGACGTLLRDGKTYCVHKPLPGSDYCHVHEHGRHNITHGLTSKRLARLGKEGQARVAHLLADDGLLDARRPVAVAEFMLEQSVSQITDHEVDRIARRLGRLADDEEPDEGLRAEARARLLREPQRVLKLLSKLQGEAQKQDRQKEVIVGLIAPHLDELGKAVGDLVHEYVPDPKRRDEFLHAVRVRLRAGQGRIVALLDDAEK